MAHFVGDQLYFVLQMKSIFLRLTQLTAVLRYLTAQFLNVHLSNPVYRIPYVGVTKNG